MREIIARLDALLSHYINIPALRPGTIGAYALAVGSAGVATVLRLAIDPYVVGVQFVTFFPAIIITTLISGFGAGFLCAVLSTAAADFFVLAPRWSFNVEDPTNVANLLLSGPLASYLVIIIARMRIAVEREQAEASRDRLQLALDAAQLGSCTYDVPPKVVSGDRRFREIFDVSANVLPIEDLKKRVHPDDAERFLADRQASIDPAGRRPSPHEYRIQRRDGEARWVEVHRLVNFAGAGDQRRAVSVVGTVQDTTECKEHAERLHLLMREVNHRAKNMLGVVDAIARKIAASSPQDYVGRFTERIQALAATQDLLVRSEWKGIEIGDLTRAQLAPFADLIGSRIKVRGPVLRLNAASAQAVGLALHELTANAGEHGALSKDTGRFDIGWSTEGETFTMSWTEHDGPPVSAPQRRGFGRVVMQEMAERTVDGNVDLEYAPSGVTWRLTCPAAKALEPLRT
jgi:PAS domain S-box-containing protein